MTAINTNTSATVTSNALSKNERVLEQTMERLSTGKRINSASDDAAGLAIASKMTSQINGLNQAGRNANDAISMIQTADGAAIEIGNMLQRMRELAVQSANGTNTDADIANLNIEFASLADEIDRVVDGTQWNGMAILDGSAGSGSNGVMSFQIGANDSQTVTVDFADFNMADGTGGSSTVTAATAAVYTSTIDISDYSSGDTLAVAGVTYTATGSETDLSTLVTALNASTATTATPYTFSASGTTLTMTADAGGAIASDPTAIGSIALTNTETTAGAVDAFAVYTATIDISDYAASDTLTIAGETYTATGSETDLSNLVSALNLSTATTATPYTWSASGTTLTATANAAGAVASDPTLVGAVAVTTATTTTGSATAFAVYTSAIDVTDYDAGDIITSNGTAYTVTGSETDNSSLITALNASTTAATALYTYSTSGTDIVMTQDAAAVVGTDPTTAVAKAYTATEATAGAASAAALYTSAIDVTDYAAGDVITANGTSYTVTGSEADNSALVTALNASTTSATADYTYAGTTNLTMTQDTAAAVSSAPTITVVTADTVAEGTAGAAAVTASSTGVFGVALGGAMSSSATIDTETTGIISTLDTALAGLASQRATFGAAINRLEYTVDNLMNVSQNTSASRSRIEDADYAAETTELARAQIIAQAGTAMLAQANQQAQNVLTLLKG